MFQVFHCLQTYIASVVSGCSKVNRVLHLPPHFLLPRLIFSSSRRRFDIQHAPPPILDASDVLGGVGPTWARETVREMMARCEGMVMCLRGRCKWGI
jgi:hypothetical protein